MNLHKEWNISEIVQELHNATSLVVQVVGHLGGGGGSEIFTTEQFQNNLKQITFTELVTYQIEHSTQMHRYLK